MCPSSGCVLSTKGEILSPQHPAAGSAQGLTDRLFWSLIYPEYPRTPPSVHGTLEPLSAQTE